MAGRELHGLKGELHGLKGVLRAEESSTGWGDLHGLRDVTGVAAGSSAGRVASLVSCWWRSGSPGSGPREIVPWSRIRRATAKVAPKVCTWEPPKVGGECALGVAHTHTSTHTLNWFMCVCVRRKTCAQRFYAMK